MTKPVIEVTEPADDEAQGHGAERIRETRQALYDIFPINPDDLDYQQTANYWPAGSATGGMDPEVEDGTRPPHEGMQDRAFLLSDIEVNYDYQIPVGKNAIVAGPVYFNSAIDANDGVITVVGNNDTDPHYLRDLEDVQAGAYIVDQNALLWHQSDNVWKPGPAPQGETGEDGQDGADGADGIQGERGPQGPIGNTGQTGAKGDTGERGPTGTAGKDGAKGDTGLRGLDGPEGPEGPQGDKGDQGTSIRLLGGVNTPEDLPGWPNAYGGEEGDAYIVELGGIHSDDGEIWVWNGTVWFDAGHIVGPEGQQGPQGPDGFPGDKGEDGTDGVDGLKGDEGDPGPKGDPGEQGLEGVPGIEGPRGEQGIAGPSGTNGANGAQGVEGQVGADGAQGDEGAVGPRGPEGHEGPSGLDGTVGPAGDPGSDGLDGNNSLYGGGLEEVFQLAPTEINVGYTIPENTNASTVGPIKLNANVEISDGSTWVII